MSDIPIASDLSYFVSQKIRREQQGGAASLHQSGQGTYPRVATGTRGDVLLAFFGNYDGDRAQPNPPRVAVGERDAEG